MHDLQHLFDTEQFTLITTRLQGHTLTPVEDRILGVSLLYTSQLEAAELPLARAAFSGEAEAQVEYGNLLRLLGRHTEAICQFEHCTPHLTGELHDRALRWWGVTLFTLGDHRAGLERVTQAWRGYLTRPDRQAQARINMTLAEMHRLLGNPRRAGALLRETVQELKDSSHTGLHLSALKLLAELQVVQGRFDEARAHLDQGYAVLEDHPSPRHESMLLTVEADIQRLTGTDTTDTLLRRLFALADELAEDNLLLWATTRLADWQSAHGQAGQALATLLSYPRRQPDWPMELWLTSGILARRRGDAVTALQDCEQAIRMCRASERVPELIRALLHAAAAALQAGQPTQVATRLRECLTLMLHHKQFSLYAPDFEETQHLLQYAMLEPDIAPYLEPLLGQIARLINSPVLPVEEMLTLEITTFGQGRIQLEGRRLELNRPGIIALLVYLQQHPGATRVQLQLAMWPDEDRATGAARVRQCFQDLRQQLGRSVIERRGPPRAPQYFLALDVQLQTDLAQFWDAARERDIARMLGLYQGPFLSTFEFDAYQWVQDTRLELQTILKAELRAQIQQYQEVGDARRAVLLLNWYLRVAPDEADLSLLTLRLELARPHATPVELSKYELALHRSMN